MKQLRAILILVICFCSDTWAADVAADRLESGRRMYMDGLLPSGEHMSATVQGDIQVSGEQVICGACHRRSGMGASEGQEVVPSVTGDILYQPLRLPTSRPPLPPDIRPAYNDESLKRAIRDGIGANGKPLGALMPRYVLTDDQLDILLGYLKTLSTETAPGVTARDMHLATIVSDAVPEASRKAHLDVMEAFVKQKNTETRNESHRAQHGPWHKDTFMKSYRKWVLHVWELKGSAETWPEQLEAYYRNQPVFAVVGGLAPGSWGPVHEFCECEQLPCLFPTTRLPVISEDDFYTVYFSRGMTLEGEVIAQHLRDGEMQDKPVVQVFRAGDEQAQVAAGALRARLAGKGVKVTDVTLAEVPDAAFWGRVGDQGDEAVVVLWLDDKDLADSWEALEAANSRRLYLSTSLFNGYESVPASVREKLLFVTPRAMGTKLKILLARSTGWLRMKRILDLDQQEVQANAFFALKLAGGSAAKLRGFFNRDYLLEQVEHMVDSAFYTSVYPRISLAPGQRFVAKGCYIARLSDTGRLQPVSDWLIPGSGN